MGLFVKGGTWKNWSTFRVKTNSGWQNVKKGFIKSAYGWLQFFPTAYIPDHEVTISQSTGSDYLITLTGTNYHWASNPTLTYDFQYLLNGSWYSVYTNTLDTGLSGPYSISNPSSGSTNTVTYKILNDGTITPDAVSSFRFVVFGSGGQGSAVSISSKTDITGPTTPSLTATLNSNGSVTLTPSNVGSDLSFSYFRNYTALNSNVDSFPPAGASTYEVRGWTGANQQGYESYYSGESNSITPATWYCLTVSPYYPGIAKTCGWTTTSYNASGSGTGYSTFCQTGSYPNNGECIYQGASNPGSGNMSGSVYSWVTEDKLNYPYDDCIYYADPSPSPTAPPNSTINYTYSIVPNSYPVKGGCVYPNSKSSAATSVNWKCDTYDPATFACSYNIVYQANDPSSGYTVCSNPLFSSTYPLNNGCGGSASQSPAYGNATWYCTQYSGTNSNYCSYSYFNQIASPTNLSIHVLCSTTQYPAYGHCPQETASTTPPSGGYYRYWCTTYDTTVPFYSCAYYYSEIVDGTSPLTKDAYGYASSATSCYQSFNANYPVIGGCTYSSSQGTYNPPTYGTTTTTTTQNHYCSDSQGVPGPGNYTVTYDTVTTSTPYYYDGYYAGTNSSSVNQNYSGAQLINGSCGYTTPWWCVVSTVCAGVGNCTYTGPFSSNQSGNNSFTSTACFQSATQPDLSAYCGSTDCYQYYCTKEVDSYPYYDCYYTTSATTVSGYTCAYAKYGSDSYPKTLRCTYPNTTGTIVASPPPPSFPYFKPPSFPSFSPVKPPSFPSFAPPPPPHFCVFADTPILTESGEIRASDIIIGEKLKSYSFDELPDSELNYDPETWSSKSLTNAKNVIAMVDGIKIHQVDVTMIFNKDVNKRFSLDHVMFVKRNNVYMFIQSSVVEIGDYFVSDNNGQVSEILVESIDFIDNKVNVYEFRLTPYDLFVAGGLVTHNRKFRFQGPTMLDNMVD